MYGFYGTGCARSDFTTCLPVPWRGWGPLVRSKQAVFRVLDFERICVRTCLATAVELARSIRAGSNLADWSSNSAVQGALAFAENSRLKSDICFWFSGAPKMSLWTVFQSLAIWWLMGSNAPQTGTICRSLKVIKSVLSSWLVLNG